MQHPQPSCNYCTMRRRHYTDLRALGNPNRRVAYCSAHRTKRGVPAHLSPGLHGTPTRKMLTDWEICYVGAHSGRRVLDTTTAFKCAAYCSGFELDAGLYLWYTAARGHHDDTG